MTLFNFNHLPEVPPQNSITWGIRGFNIQIRGRGTRHKSSVHSTHSPLTAPGFYLKAAPWGWGLADAVEGHSRSHAPWNKIGYKEKGRGWACSVPSPGSGLFLRPLQVKEEAKQGMTRGCHLTGYSKRSVLHMRLRNFFFLPLSACLSVSFRLPSWRSTQLPKRTLPELPWDPPCCWVWKSLESKTPKG